MCWPVRTTHTVKLTFRSHVLGGYPLSVVVVQETALRVVEPDLDGRLRRRSCRQPDRRRRVPGPRSAISSNNGCRPP